MFSDLASSLFFHLFSFVKSVGREKLSFLSSRINPCLGHFVPCSLLDVSMDADQRKEETEHKWRKSIHPTSCRRLVSPAGSLISLPEAGHNNKPQLNSNTYDTRRLQFTDWDVLSPSISSFPDFFLPFPTTFPHPLDETGSGHHIVDTKNHVPFT